MAPQRASALAVMRAGLRIGGGLRGTFARALRLLLREGAGGVRRGLGIATLHAGEGPVMGSGGHGRNDYAAWRRLHDDLSEADLAVLRERAAALPGQPLISILLPLHDTAPHLLARTAASIRGQVYTNWELCAAPSMPGRPATLDADGASDPRVRLVGPSASTHARPALNALLDQARGSWIVVLEAGDRLAPHALFCLVDTINRQPDARLVYSDGDMLSETGERHSPCFKPDWNPELFHALNPVSHLAAFQTQLARAAGGFPAESLGAPAYDLALRCAERIDAARIIHLPRILHHAGPRVADGAAQAEELALARHFERAGTPARIRRAGPWRKVDYPLPAAPPLVTLIIPTRNALHLLHPCVASILERTRYAPYEILIIDNGSDDPAALAYLRGIQADARVRVRRDDGPFNFSALNNAAVREARGELIALVNNDIEVISPDWLAEMAGHALRPGIGAVGARLLYPDGTVQHAGVVLGIYGCAAHVHRHLPAGAPGYMGRAVLSQSISAVTGACLVMRKSLYEEVGGLDEEHLKISFNDIDLCLRLRARGLRNIYAADALLRHHESATRGADSMPENRPRAMAEAHFMVRRWGAALYADPAYNPNLTLFSEDCSLAWPPRVCHPRDLAKPRQENDGFDELAYLTVNPDVAEAVARGQIASGRLHYEQHGLTEQRTLNMADRMLAQN